MCDNLTTKNNTKIIQDKLLCGYKSSWVNILRFIQILFDQFLP